MARLLWVTAACVVCVSQCMFLSACMHFLLQCMKVKSESEVAQSCPTLRDPVDCSLPGSSVQGFSRQEYWSGCHCLLLLVPKKLSQRNGTEDVPSGVDDEQELA